MRRIRFIKSVAGYSKGDIAYVTPNIAFGHIDRGEAVISKEMTENDYKTTKNAKPRRKAKNG